VKNTGYFNIYGPAGGGKSTEVAKSFPQSLHIASSKNVLHFYRRWLMSPEGQASGKQLPYREIMLGENAIIDSWSTDRDADGNVKPQITIGADGLAMPIPQKVTIEQMLMDTARRALGESAAGQPLTYRNFIFDEAGEFFSRVYDEIEPYCLTENNKIDTRKAFGLLNKWTLWVIKQIQQMLLAGMNVVFVTHEGEPEPAKGKKGGPKFPSKGIMSKLSAVSEGTIMREVEEEQVVLDLSADATQPVPKREGDLIKRIWIVHLSQNWLSKLRGIPDSMYEEVKTMELEDIIRFAGFEP
jgi:hypothetical protein